MLSYKDIIDKLLKSYKIKNFPEAMAFSANVNREFSLADIDEEIGESVEAVIRYWNKIDDEQNIPIEERIPIKIYINSPGGSLNATFIMVDAIKMSKTPVWTINVGMAYSGGFLTFLAGHKKIAYRHSTFLFHEGSTGGGRQDAGKFRNYANFYDKLLEKLKDITLSNSKITEEEYEKHQLDDWWFCAEEALEKGICDEITDTFI